MLDVHLLQCITRNAESLITVSHISAQRIYVGDKHIPFGTLAYRRQELCIDNVGKHVTVSEKINNVNVVFLFFIAIKFIWKNYIFFFSWNMYIFFK